MKTPIEVSYHFIPCSYQQRSHPIPFHIILATKTPIPSVSPKAEQLIGVSISISISVSISIVPSLLSLSVHDPYDSFNP